MVPATEVATIDAALLIAGFLRLAQPRTPAPVDRRGPQAANQAQTDHTLRSRLLTINTWTLDFYRSQFPGSWSATYLTDRCGVDLADDERFQPGHAPRGGRALTHHLHSRGVTETEMIVAGVAARTTDGHLMDRFRDRLVLPIRDPQNDIVGFVARRHPDRDDTGGGPKYLNTPTTTVFAKAHQLYGSHLAPVRDPADNAGGSGAQAATAVPVLVEGPIDAIAVTLASEGRYLGLSPLGTALTERQAAYLAALSQHPVLATDPDPAGRAAAGRDFWLLAQHRCDPRTAELPQHLDPADVFTRHGANALRQSLDQATPLGDRLIDQLSRGTATRPARQDALRTLAARPPDTWHEGLQVLSRRLDTFEQTLREELLPIAQEWTTHPEEAARAALASRQNGPHTRPGQNERTGRNHTKIVHVAARQSEVPNR